MTHSTAAASTGRLLIAAAGILLPYLARLPGGFAWLEQYTAAGVGGFLFTTALDGIARGWMLVWTSLIRQPTWWLLPCGLGFGYLAWAHGSLDLSADAQAAIAVVFIPIHALVPITVGGVVGLAMDRLTRRTAAEA